MLDPLFCPHHNPSFGKCHRQHTMDVVSCMLHKERVGAIVLGNMFSPTDFQSLKNMNHVLPPRVYIFWANVLNFTPLIQKYAYFYRKHQELHI